MWDALGRSGLNALCPKEKPRECELVRLGGVTMVLPLMRPGAWLEGALSDVQLQLDRRDVASAARLAARIERRLHVTDEERSATQEVLEPWQADLERLLPRFVLAAKAPKGKAGRKASGLRDLSPEAARFVIAGHALKAVRQAVGVKTEAEKIENGSAGVPTLDRLLRGDLGFDRVIKEIAEDGAPIYIRVLRGDGGLKRLKDTGLSALLVRVAERFMRDVEGATIGKLVAGYDGFSGGSGYWRGEPERVIAALDRLGRSQQYLTRKERLSVWGTLVFGLSLTDVGHATDGDRISNVRELRTAAAIHTESALDRMAGYYLRRET